MARRYSAMLELWSTSDIAWKIRGQLKVPEDGNPERVGQAHQRSVGHPRYGRHRFETVLIPGQCPGERRSEQHGGQRRDAGHGSPPAGPVQVSEAPLQ